MWALYELDRSSVAYSSPTVQWFRGRVGSQLLVLCINHMAAVQHSLRTRYGYQDNSGSGGDAVQWVVQQTAFTVPIVELVVTTEDEAQCELQQQLHTVFELEHGVLQLAVVYAVDISACMVVLNMHHIATDGVSCALLWKQLGEAYGALQAGDLHMEVRAPEVQYIDYALWQRQCFDHGSVLSKHKAWWQHTLGAEPPLLELQPDFRRPCVLSSRNGLVSFELSGAEALTSVCRRNNATEMHGALALWATVLWRHTQQTAVVIGVPYANRARMQIQQVVGYFVNTLAVLVDVANAQAGGFDRIVEYAKEAMIGALKYGEMPLMKVAESVLGARTESCRMPLFQTMLGWQADDNRLGGIPLHDVYEATLYDTLEPVQV